MLFAMLMTLILPLALLIWIAYRGVSVMILAPLCAGLAALLAGDPVLATLTQRYMPALGGFVIAFFPLFFLGAIFGKLMEASGAATAIAEAIIQSLGPGRAILAVVAACAILTYGGVSLFVVAFAVFPLAIALFSAARLPMQIIPAAIALGAFTFTMTALPGTPAIQNAIPMPYFGTTLYAASGIGILAGLIMAVGGIVYCQWLAKRLDPIPLPGAASLADMPDAAPLWPSVLPIATVLVLNYTLSVWLFPAFDTSYLALPEWGELAPSDVTGLWALIASLIGAILLLIVLHRPRLPELRQTLTKGGEAALVPLFNTACLVGFGAVIASLPAFADLRQAIDAVPGGPVLGLSVSALILSGITGSASGGMTIALDALGDTYMEAAQADDIDPALLHRMTALATGALDALPHNGAVITLLSIAGLTHKQAYGPIFVVAVAIPMLAFAVSLGIVLFL